MCFFVIIGGGGGDLFVSESDFLCTEIDAWTHLKAVKTTIAVMREMSEVA